ncbi:hypothetical protein AJ78_05529, partial [Emergomyces pasteurianus Ep9510]
MGFGRFFRRESRGPKPGGSQVPPAPVRAISSSPSPCSSNITSLSTCTTDVSTSTGPAKAPISPPSVFATTSRDLWFQALQKLANDEQQIIIAIQSIKATACPLSDSIAELVQMTRRKQEECESKYYRFSLRGKQLILRDVAEKVIFWLNKFKGIGDVAVGFDQAHASLPWAGVRFMLQAAVAESEQMGALLVAVERVTYLVGRCAVYESLYTPRNTPAEPLQNFHGALVRLYAAVLRLLALSHRLFSKSTAARTLLALVKPNDVLESVASCQDLEIRVDVEAQNCERALSRDSRELDTKARRLLENLSTPILRSDDKVSSLLQTITDEEHLKILDWISEVLYGRNHATVKDTRTSGTCEWLLKRLSYMEWKNTSSSMILWLYGTAGTGKTYLTSRVIDDIRGALKINSNDEGFAFFYCNRNEAVRREPLEVLRSFVRQLSSTANNQHAVQTCIRQYYIQSRQEASEPTINDCRKLLLDLINIYPKTTLILDALDECEDHSRSVVIEFFQYLVSQAARPVKIFISSRPDIDIRNKFNRHTNIGIQAKDNDDDISKFVKSEISGHPRWNKMSAELQNDIIETLQKRSQGMFQWTYLQIKQLLVLQQEGPIRNRLGKLPIDLKHAYDEIFDGMGETERKIADRALQWVIGAQKPLTTKVLLPAVCQTGGALIYPIGDLDEDLILKYCQNLLVIDPVRQVWVPSHLSVIEYCEDNLWSQQQANCFVATVLGVSQRVNFPHNDQELKNLHQYAATSWVLHVQGCESWEDKNNCISNYLEQFLGSPTESGAAYRGWVIWVQHLHDGCYRSGRNLSIPIEFLEPASIPAFAACAFGFYTTLPNWWANQWADCGQRNYEGHSLLQLAAIGMSVPICELLLGWGVDVNEQLTASAYRNIELARSRELAESLREYEDVLPAFLSRLAHPSHDYPTVFSKEAYIRAVQTGLYMGNKQPLRSAIKISSISPYPHYPYDNALAAALSSTEGSDLTPLLDSLLKTGADVNAELRCGLRSSVLEMAAAEHSKEIVQLLLDAGADVNAPLAVGKYGSGPTAAALENYLEATQTFIGAGANVNATRAFEEYGSALAAAAAENSMEVVQLLLDAGADVNAPLAVG